jgi:hypothetical protein
MLSSTLCARTEKVLHETCGADHSDARETTVVLMETGVHIPQPTCSKFIMWTGESRYEVSGRSTRESCTLLCHHSRFSGLVPTRESRK